MIFKERPIFSKINVGTTAVEEDEEDANEDEDNDGTIVDASWFSSRSS
jgi:hypothetical protein